MRRLYLSLQKKQKVNKNELPILNQINKFKIIYSKSDNKNLTLINVDLNKGYGGEYIYLTYGFETNKPLSPIVDFFIYIENLNKPPDGYLCDDNNLNKGTKKGRKIHLCYKRNDEIPTKILINDIELFYFM